MDAITPSPVNVDTAAMLQQAATFKQASVQNDGAPVGVDQDSNVLADFESIFYSLMLKTMRSTLTEGGLFGKEASDTYGGMFDLFMSQHLAQSQPLGIGQALQGYLQAADQSGADL